MEKEEEKATLRALTHKLEQIVRRLDTNPKTQLLEDTRQAHISVTRLVEPEFSFDTVTYEEGIYAEAAVVEYLTKRFGTPDDEYVFWPSDWNECPEAYELYKEKVGEFRAAEAVTNIDRLKKLVESLTEESEGKPAETEQKEIVEVKPGAFGITVNIKEIAKRIWKCVCSRSKD